MAARYESDIVAGNAEFATTRWSLIAVARGPATPAAREALNSLCGLYWYPLYAFARRQGHSAADAQDLTQDFFARLLEREDLRDVSPDRGRFRSFLLASMKHFMINEWDRAQAAKRGGGVMTWSIDYASAESRYRTEPADARTPDSLFERAWALATLDRVREGLREEFVADGKGDQFERLQGYLTGDAPETTYGAIAEELGTTEGAVKMAVSRLRRRFRDRLREEIAATVATPEEVDDEIRTLIEALRS